jgi:hypothetical protein
MSSAEFLFIVVVDPGMVLSRISHEHCVNFEDCSSLLKVPQRNTHNQIATMLMRDAGYRSLNDNNHPPPGRE